MSPASRARGTQHRGGFVHGNHLFNKRCHRLGELTGTAAEVADDRVAIEQPEEGVEFGARAKEFGAEFVPLRGTRGKELLARGVSVGEYGAHALGVARGGGVRAEVVAHRLPEPARGGGEFTHGHAIAITRAVFAAHDPTGVRERAQMAAHRALGELESRAQFADREFVPLEDEQEPGTNRVGERGEAIEDRVFLHPYIRMKGCLLTAPRQGARDGRSWARAGADGPERARGVRAAVGQGFLAPGLVTMSTTP